MSIFEIAKAALIFPLLFFLIIAGCAKTPDHRHGRHQGPPPEAIQACADKTDGSKLVFTGRNGEAIEANCREIDGQLVAVPQTMPEGLDQPN
jgi:hypothetical protein